MESTLSPDVRDALNVLSRAGSATSPYPGHSSLTRAKELLEATLAGSGHMMPPDLTSKWAALLAEKLLLTQALKAAHELYVFYEHAVQGQMTPAPQSMSRKPSSHRL